MRRFSFLAHLNRGEATSAYYWGKGDPKMTWGSDFFTLVCSHIIIVGVPYAASNFDLNLKTISG